MTHRHFLQALHITQKSEACSISGRSSSSRSLFRLPVLAPERPVAGVAAEVRDVEADLNQLEVELDDLCVSVIAKRQPTARDLRTVVSVMKVITDLERIGDEADRIARMALDLANSEIPSHQYSDFRTLQTNAIKSLKKALDAFARLDIEVALRVIEDDEMIDDGYKNILRRCSEQMQSDPTEVERLLRVMWAA